NQLPFNNALYLCRQRPEWHHALGFAFTRAHRYVGIDVDLYKLAEGSSQRRVAGYVLQFPTLTTLSASGRGFHIYGWSNTACEEVPPVRQSLLGAIELYRSKRFFAETLEAVRDVPIANVDDLIAYIESEHVSHGGRLAETIPPSADDLPPADQELEAVIEQ